MVSQTTKLRLRRRMRRGRRQVEDIGAQATDKIDQHIINRLSRLIKVRRFIAVWVGLLVLLTVCVVYQTMSLSSYFQTLRPVSGGEYTEGILGDFTTANPIYATSSVDEAISRLTFAGLLTYNTQNQLVGNLAQSWSVNSSGEVYTVKLKPGLTWQDGQPLTAADVVYTYKTIQNPDAQSPLNQAWQNVTVTEVNPLTVSFSLSNPLASFPYSLTNGILPEHILASTPAAALRLLKFNTDPIGCGPFVWQSLSVAGDTPQTRQEQIAFTPFSHYALGKPKLDQLTIRAFHDQTTMISAFKQGEINALAGFDNLPGSLAGRENLKVYNFPLTAANMVFFRTTDGVLADTAVRQALVMGANTDAIINGLGYPVIPVREPLLIGQLAYSSSAAQLAYNPALAGQTLQSNGWTTSASGIRYKSGQQLTFSLYALDNQDSRYVTAALQKDWRTIGVNVKVVLQAADAFQSTVAYHGYDALLYSISIGVDPDVYVYWNSTEASASSAYFTNYSEYQSATADSSLEAGRTRLDPALRVVKYGPFLSSWQQAAPALGLYQPRFLYITNVTVGGIYQRTLNEPNDLFDNVQNWAVKFVKVTD
jgi:peptide/nickel transport system substrate-binding protein